MTAAYSVLAPDQVTHAAPQLTTLQRVGGSIGTAILTVILQTHLESAGASPAAMADAFGTTFVWVMGITAAALLPTVMLARIERRARGRDATPGSESPPAEAEARELALESA
jgi:hypothetical protein